MDLAPKISTITPFKIAAIPVVGMQQLPQAFHQLLQWCAQQGLNKDRDFKMLTVFQDSARDTPLEKIRAIAGATLTNSFDYLPQHIQVTTIVPGACVVARATLSQQDFPSAWQQLYQWKNEQQLQVSTQDPFVIYYNDYRDHPQQYSTVDLCIPVVN